MRKWIILSMIVLIATTQHACSSRPEPIEPTSFKGITIGAPVEEVKKKLNNPKCRTLEVDFDAICIEDDSNIGKTKVSEITYIFRKDKLISISMKFDVKQYEYLKDLYIEKYGTPYQKADKITFSDVGMPLNNQILVWKGSNVATSIRRFKNDAHNGSILYVLVNELDGIAKENKIEKEKEKKEALGDI